MHESNPGQTNRNNSCPEFLTFLFTILFHVETLLMLWRHRAPENLIPLPAIFLAQKTPCYEIILLNGTEYDFRPSLSTLYEPLQALGKYSSILCSNGHHIIHCILALQISLVEINHTVISTSLQFVNHVINSLQSTIENSLPVSKMRANDPLLLFQPWKDGKGLTPHLELWTT